MVRYLFPGWGENGHVAAEAMFLARGGIFEYPFPRLDPFLALEL